jgi:CDP-paratose 2-epimerase
MKEANGHRPRRRRHTLITGGAGFLGTNVADRLLSEGCRIRILDNMGRSGVERNLRWLRSKHGDRLTVQVADVRDRRAVSEAVDSADTVIHLAAQVAVTTSLEEPLDDFGVNLEGTITLLEELRRLRRPVPLLFTSTNKVYGSLPDVRLERVGDRWEPVQEDLRGRGVGECRPLAFCTPYGCSKGGADQYVLDYGSTYGLPAVVFRMSCIYGHHQCGNEDQGWVAHFLIRALERKSLTIYGDGAQVRDVLFAPDLVQAMLSALNRIDDVAGSAFNIGGGPRNTISLIELLHLIEELHGERPDVQFAPQRPGDQRWYVSDPTAAGRALSWEPKTAPAEGIASLYRWLGGRTDSRLLAAAGRP